MRVLNDWLDDEEALQAGRQAAYRRLYGDEAVTVEDTVVAGSWLLLAGILLVLGVAWIRDTVAAWRR